jgi:hypothetical protein
VIYYATCRHCRTKWQHLPPPSMTMDLIAAIGVMEKGLCPTCQNDGSRAPINWKFSFGGNREPHYGQIRRKEA